MSRTVGLLIASASVLMGAGMLAAVPWFIRRLPSDYFVRLPQESSLAIRIARNAGGIILVALGVAMLVLPGQGVLTIVFGLSLLDFPAKHRALRWLLYRNAIWSSIQQLRLKLGRPPLVMPERATG